MNVELLHGYGGNGFNKFVTLSISTTTPVSPGIYDIWINDNDTSASEVYFYETPPTLNNNDILVGIGNQQMLTKKNIDKNNKHAVLPVQTGNSCKFFESEFFDLYGSYTVLKKNKSGAITVLAAYYWNSTAWVQFSFTDDLILMQFQDSSNNAYYGLIKASDLSIVINDVPSSSIGVSAAYIGSDNDRQRLYFSGVKEVTNLLEVVNTITTTYTHIFYKNGKYYAVTEYISGNTYLKVYDITSGGTGTLIFTAPSYLITGATVIDVALSQDKNYLYVVTSRIVSSNVIVSYRVLNISNLSAITEVASFDAGDSTIQNIGFLPDRLIVLSNNGSKIVIEERSLDNTTVLKSVTTTLDKYPTNTSYTYRYFVGKDSEGNYYISDYYNYGATSWVSIIKIDNYGVVQYTKQYNGSYSPQPMIMTKGERILFTTPVSPTTSNKKINLINKTTGDISVSSSAYTHYVTKICKTIQNTLGIIY